MRVRRTERGGWWSAITVAACLLFTGCVGGETEPTYVVATGGDPDRGERVIEAAGCGTCHTIPGVRGARGRIAPPLHFFSERSFIAGAVPNSPEYLVQWMMEPESIEPGTAMPDVGLTEQQARDVAAYLYTIR